jgi:hypothetical protein
MDFVKVAATPPQPAPYPANAPAIGDHGPAPPPWGHRAARALDAPAPTCRCARSLASKRRMCYAFRVSGE